MTKICGVYALEFDGTEKFYVGSSVEVSVRERVHRNALLKGTHKNRYLQNVFNKCGDFTLRLLEECSEEVVREREQFYLDSMDWDLALNLCRSAYGASPGELHHPYGKTHTEEARRKISGANKGNTHTEEARRKISEAKIGEKNPNYGKTFSEETRRKISESERGADHHFYGKNLSEEHRRKLSEAMSGKGLGGNNTQAKPVTLDGVHYSCKKDAMAALGLSFYKLNKLLAKDLGMGK